ncbi:MAG: hypothetical protein E6Q24_07270 [Chitinophagaceae bacterium]|nr:MAG: hypothetical protein E6Q24_07270 [Chitinophagaceae bacterium]
MRKAIDRKIRKIIDIAWEGYIHQVALGTVNPHREAVMQFQFMVILQNLFPLFLFREGETISLVPEYPLQQKSVDVTVLYTLDEIQYIYPIEMKCSKFSSYGEISKKSKSGIQWMHGYWKDIARLEEFTQLADVGFCTHLAFTDDVARITGKHQGKVVKTFSTNQGKVVSGLLHSDKHGSKFTSIHLKGTYTMNWRQIGQHYFIRQEIRKPEQHH